jgi:hypothetical protein
VPASIVSGHFDNDEGADLLWDITTRKGTSYEVAYARMVGGEPLSALSIGQGSVADAIEVGDVTNDKLDDVIVTGHGSLVDLATRGVAVIPTQVKPVEAMIAPDPPCSP